MGQKILWDCHMHSSFSADSETPMEDMIQTAVDKGLTGICFTEHLDPDYPETPENLDFSLDIPAYRQRLFELADAFRDQISVNFGIELGLQPHLSESFSGLLKEIPFDFVIGSSHMIPIILLILKAGKNPPAIWNILNPFWKISPHLIKWMSTDTLIM